jgi:heterodisulfide reductase subunit B
MLVATFGEIAEQLCNELVGWAVERDANCIVTVCPLCQINLDLLSLNGAANGAPLPVLYFTQLVGLALGCTPEELGLQHGLASMEIESPRLASAAAGSTTAHTGEPT